MPKKGASRAQKQVKPPRRFRMTKRQMLQAELLGCNPEQYSQVERLLGELPPTNLLQ